MGVNRYRSERERTILESAVIGIAGAGGLGSNCACHLVRSGVRNLILADFDTVNASNLNRQFFFQDQLGLPKVDALADNLRRISPDLNLTLHNCRLTPRNMPEIFASCTMVAECFDQSESKMDLIQIMAEEKKPLVGVSGIAGWGRSTELAIRKIGKTGYLIGDFHTGVSADNPPFSPRVGIAAAMQANTILSLLLGEAI